MSEYSELSDRLPVSVIPSYTSHLVDSLRSRAFLLELFARALESTANLREKGDPIVLVEAGASDGFVLHRNGRQVRFERDRRDELQAVIVIRDCFPASIVPWELRRERIAVPAWPDLDGLARDLVRSTVELIRRES